MFIIISSSSITLFIPGALIIEAGLFGWLAYGMCIPVWASSTCLPLVTEFFMPHPDRFWRPFDYTVTPLYSVVCVVFFTKWIAVVIICVLRVVAFISALYNTCRDNRRAQQTFQSYISHTAVTAFQLIFRLHFDWWALQPLPVDFRKGTWHQRFRRPFFESRLQTHMAVSVVKPLPEIVFGEHLFRPRR